MDIYDYLKMDHRKVSKLFKLFMSAPTPQNEKETFLLIKKELMLHAIAEQETFYKILEQNIDSESDALHAEQEHFEILTKLNEISLLVEQNKLGAPFKNKVIELKNRVEHHVAEEESTIFNKAKKLLSEDEAYIIKEQMHDYKEKLQHNATIQEEALAEVT